MQMPILMLQQILQQAQAQAQQQAHQQQHQHQQQPQSELVPYLMYLLQNLSPEAAAALLSILPHIVQQQIHPTHMPYARPVPDLGQQIQLLKSLLGCCGTTGSMPVPHMPGAPQPMPNLGLIQQIEMLLGTTGLMQGPPTHQCPARHPFTNMPGAPQPMPNLGLIQQIKMLLGTTGSMQGPPTHQCPARDPFTTHSAGAPSLGFGASEPFVSGPPSTHTSMPWRFDVCIPALILDQI